VIYQIAFLLSCLNVAKDTIMLRLLTASAILAIAAPAIAQQTDAMDAPPAPADAPAPAAEPAPAPQAAAAPEAAPPPADRAAQVAKLVDSEFPTYDADKNGELSQLEFSKWMMALHSKAESSGNAAKKDAAAKDKWAKDAFIQADADKSKKISKAEMSKFLQG
jgi:hypothetical protein